MSYCFKITISAEICKKCVIFIQKLQNRPEPGVLPHPCQKKTLKNPGYAACIDTYVVANCLQRCVRFDLPRILTLRIMHTGLAR